MTTTELVTAVKDHIGDRQTGMIGSQTVDNACLASVNKAIRKIATIPNFNPDELVESQSLALTSSNYSYTLPTFTHGTVKSIAYITSNQTSETEGRDLIELSQIQAARLFALMDSSRTGRPSHYWIFHKTTIKFYPWPDSTYTANIIANCYPNELALGLDTPYDEIWDEAIEAYATFDVFAKLQQTQDAATWFKIWTTVKFDTLGALRKYPNRIVDINARSPRANIGNEPGLDPMIRSVR
jgi:hypothetical protein